MTAENYHIAFINLPHRTDRLAHMESQLSRVGIQAVKLTGMYPHEYRGPEEKVAVMRRRTPGAIGCHYSQVKIMQAAWAMDRHAWVMEDDIIFCLDFQERMNYIENWMKSHEWDVVWLGASFHISPAFWHCHGQSKMPPDCSANLGYDAKRTDDPRMIRTYGAYITFAYIVNRTSLEKVLSLLDQHVHESIGIDWEFIKLQPQLKCFCYVPGLIKQMDNMSDIGTGMTIWSGHLALGPYVYQERAEDFNPDTFDWHEAR